MSDQWEDAAKNFKPTQDKSTDTSAPSDRADDSWKVWQKNGGEPGTASGGVPHTAIPEGTPIMGSPILPSGQIIPSAIGYGVSKIGEHIGLPDWANAAAGVVAGGLSGMGSSVVSRIAGLSSAERPEAIKAIVGVLPKGPAMVKAWEAAHPVPAPTGPFQPMRPNPAVAAKMRFGGPADASGGAAYTSVGMSGAPVSPPAVEPIAAPSFQPNKVNPNIARNLRFTPGGDSGGPAVSAIPSRVSGTPVSDLAPIRTIPSGSPTPPAYSGPSRVNPNIAKNLRFTPSDTQGGSAASPATLGTRAEMLRQIRLRQQGIASPDDAVEAIEPRTFANGGIKTNIRRK